ncbi:hypothetical protein BH11ARM2_BH11ARM2_23670 [soil metagenome]
MNTTRKRLALVPIGLYILSTPFYVLPPAYPQVAHLLMALITIGLLFTVPMPTGPTFRKSVIAFAIFVIYTYIVNGAFSIVTNDYGVLMSSVYFTFNFVSFLSIGKYYDTYGSEFLRFVLIMTAYSLCLQAFFGITGLHPGAKGYRSTLFFNNPNQLGYWTLIASSLVAIGSTRLKINTFFLVLSLTSGMYLASLALSKAALISIGVLFLFVSVKRPVVIASVLVMIVAFVASPYSASVIDGFDKRVATIGESNDDSAEGRGYDRISDFPKYWAFGAGEGAYIRFSEDAKELHSTLGTMFFCYGIVGSLLFTYFIMGAFQGSRLAWQYSMPTVLYGITHNGLRSTAAWLFVAFTFCLVCEMRRERRESEALTAERRAPPPSLEAVPSA